MKIYSPGMSAFREQFPSPDVITAAALARVIAAPFDVQLSSEPIRTPKLFIPFAGIVSAKLAVSSLPAITNASVLAHEPVKSPCNLIVAGVGSGVSPE